MNANVRTLRSSSTASRRQKVDWPARCGAPGMAAPCRILDISKDGARLSGLTKPSRDNSVLLFFEDASVSATIVWRDRDRVGLRFHQQQVWIQDNNERRFDAAAWLR
ncbi:MAG TPA: PilZ domain-containing protein [Rhizomicrobium sp.]|nr:PilZ domain-containing protein [Rhizomicrobium sp.]